MDDTGHQVKLADFGTSIRCDNFQQDNIPRGTEAFMAPEVNNVIMLMCFTHSKTVTVATLVTTSNLGRVPSRSRLWDHYWGRIIKLAVNFVSSNDPTSDCNATHPRWLLVSKVVNCRSNVILSLKLAVSRGGRQRPLILPLFRYT